MSIMSSKFKPNLNKAVKLSSKLSERTTLNENNSLVGGDDVPVKDQGVIEGTTVSHAQEDIHHNGKNVDMKMDLAGNEGETSIGESIISASSEYNNNFITTANTVSNTVKPNSKFKPKVGVATSGNSSARINIPNYKAPAVVSNMPPPDVVAAPKAPPMEIPPPPVGHESPKAHKVKAKVKVMFATDADNTSQAKRASPAPIQSKCGSSSSSSSAQPNPNPPSASVVTKEEMDEQIKERVQQLLDQSFRARPVTVDREPVKPIKKRGLDSNTSPPSYDDEMLIFQMPKGGSASLSSSRKMAVEARNWKKKVAISVQESSTSSSSTAATTGRKKSRATAAAKNLVSGEIGRKSASGGATIIAPAPASIEEVEDAQKASSDPADAQKRVKRSRASPLWQHARLPRAFGDGTAYSTYSRYLRLRPEGIGLLVRVIDGRVVVQGFSDHIPTEYVTPNSEGTHIKINDVIMSVNQLDSVTTSADRLLSALRYKERIQQESARMVNTHVSQDSVRVTFARPIFNTTPLEEEVTTV